MDAPQLTEDEMAEIKKDVSTGSATDFSLISGSMIFSSEVIGFTDQISVTCLKEEVARHTLVHSLYHEVQCSKKECTFEPVYVQVELLASRINLSTETSPVA